MPDSRMFEQAEAALRQTPVQLLLFISILYTAYTYSCQLILTIAVAGGSALLVLLLVRSLVSQPLCTWGKHQCCLIKVICNRMHQVCF